MTRQEFIDREERFGVHDICPLPVVLQRGKGIFVWDTDGHKYFDFLAAYSSVNQGHCHHKIINALCEQASRLPLTSRAFLNDALGEWEEHIATMFGYDKVLPMTTTAESINTAIILCRQWAYRHKGIANDVAKIIVCNGSSHGGAITTVTCDKTSEFVTIRHNNLAALAEALSDPNVAGFLVEPIQCNAGVIIPDDGYLREAWKLCRSHNVPFIADETQTGLGRTGRMFACDREEVRPDILITGNSLGGGTVAMSAVLTDNEIMSSYPNGHHGSVFGGNPMACRASTAALQVLVEEGMAENAERMGDLFRERISGISSELVGGVRGRGLLNAVDIIPRDSIDAWNICLKMRDNGLLATTIGNNTIMFTPPLVIEEYEMYRACNIIEKSILSFNK